MNERGMLRRLQHFPRPPPVLDIQQRRPAGIGHFGRMNAGQLVPDVIFRQQHLDHLVISLPLMVPQPDDLRRREPGQHGVTDILHQVLLPHLRRDPVALRLRPLIAPEQRGPQDVVVFVQKHRPVHLPRQPDARDLLAPDARLLPAHSCVARTVPCHQSSGSCSAHSGRGV